MQGAYRPMPSVINAPRIKLPPSPSASLVPSRPMVPTSVPPPPMLRQANNAAATSNAPPMPACTVRLGQLDTTLAPRYAPETAARIMSTRVIWSTSMAAV